MIRVVFFGSDQYSQIVLAELKKDKHLKIVSLKARPDVGVIASFGQIIPREILNLPKHGILNIHPSLLPKYRGPTPIPAAILAGEKETGVTIIKIDEEVDHGPIVSQFKEPINPNDTSDSLLNRCFSAGAKVLLAILPDYCQGRIKLRPQDHPRATYTKKFNRDDGRIDWQKPDAYQDCFIRAMSPSPGAWATVLLQSNQSPKRLKILKVHLENKKLIIDQVQLEGKKPVTFKQFREGYPEAKLPLDTNPSMS